VADSSLQFLILSLIPGTLYTQGQQESTRIVPKRGAAGQSACLDIQRQEIFQEMGGVRNFLDLGATCECEELVYG